MSKQLIIRIGVLAALVLILLFAQDVVGREMYRNIMTAMGCWQLGTWSGDFADYLVGKFCD